MSVNDLKGDAIFWTPCSKESFELKSLELIPLVNPRGVRGTSALISSSPYGF